MSGAISSLGSSQIQSQIATVESRLQAPVTQLQNQQTADKAIISAWGTVQGAVSSVSTALAGIKDISTINNRAATTGLESIATATATNTAIPGTYTLSGVTLAKSQEIYSGVLGSGSASLGSGSGSLTITLKSGKTESVPIAAGGTTLNGLAQAINALAGGVQASVIGTAGGARLVLQGSGTGSSQAFSVKGTGILSKFDYSSATGSGGSGSFVKAQQATDASFKINGVPVSAATNTITTAVTGVTIALVGSGTTTLSVSSSPGGIAGAVGAVATSLSAALAAIAKQTAYVPASSASGNATSAQAGVLLGNFTASDLTNQLLSRVSSAAASGQTSNTIGLKVSSTGSVSFDSATFSAAYAANPTAVTALVNQIYNNLSSVTSGALGSGSNQGSIAAQEAAQNANVTSINAQITSINKSNAAQLQILLQQYTAAETASSQASITQAYLSLFNTSGSSSTKG